MAESILTENDLANCTSGCGYENWYQSGKIYIKGPSVMKGYFGIKEATAEAIDSEEWLRSGDIGYYDDEDDFYIVDRAKELFKSGDRQVSSVELEVPAIADVAVIGIPDNSAGELPRAYVVKREGEKVTTDEITQYKSATLRNEVDSRIVRGPEIDFEKELEETSLDEYLIAAAELRKNPVLMTDSETDKILTIKEFLRQSRNLAAELQEMGYKEGSIVGLMSFDRLETPVVILGTMMIGATLTSYIPKFSVDELRPIFNIAKPTLVFCSAETCDKIRAVAPPTNKIVVFDSLPDNSPDLKFSQLIAAAKTPQKVKNAPDDTACILYSSGTTGLPKGVMLTHKNLVFVMKLLERNIVENNGQMFLQTSISSHISGYNILLGAIVRNETLVVMPPLEPRKLLSIIKKYEFRRLLLLPGVLTFVLKSPDVSKSDLASLEFIWTGAAVISAETELALMHKFDLKYVQQLYGMTETAMYTTITPSGSVKAGTCGRPVPGVQLKVVDIETGDILGKGQKGEICIKGPSIMKGYFGNEKATAETIDGDEWLHSGDLGYYDDENDFYIVDRVKELIKVGGKQVSPAELEGYLLEHPAIADAAVIGIPDELIGELPRAYVVKRKGQEATEDQIAKFIAGKVLEYKKLDGGVEFVSSIPKNATGKILRKELRELWKNKNKPQ